MPVGQEVTATIRNGRSWGALGGVIGVVGDRGGGGEAARRRRHGVFGTRLRGRAGCVGRAGSSSGTSGASGSSPRISAAAAAASPTARRASVNSAFISCRASDDRIVRWASSAPAGAAIRKIRSAGPSAAPKSMPVGAAPEGERRLGDVLAAAVRDADAAVEAGRHLGLAGGHVGEEAVQVGHPAQGHHALGEGARRRFLGVGGQVEVDQVRRDHVAHRGLLSTRIARSVRWAGEGTGVRWGVTGVGAGSRGRLAAQGPVGAARAFMTPAPSALGRPAPPP